MRSRLGCHGENARSHLSRPAGNGSMGRLFALWGGPDLDRARQEMRGRGDLHKGLIDLPLYQSALLDSTRAVAHLTSPPVSIPAFNTSPGICLSACPPPSLRSSRQRATSSMFSP